MCPKNRPTCVLRTFTNRPWIVLQSVGFQLHQNDWHQTHWSSAMDERQRGLLQGQVWEAWRVAMLDIPGIHETVLSVSSVWMLVVSWTHEQDPQDLASPAPSAERILCWCCYNSFRQDWWCHGPQSVWEWILFCVALCGTAVYTTADILDLHRKLD